MKRKHRLFLLQLLIAYTTTNLCLDYNADYREELDIEETSLMQYLVRFRIVRAIGFAVYGFIVLYVENIIVAPIVESDLYNNTIRAISIISVIAALLLYEFIANLIGSKILGRLPVYEDSTNPDDKDD